MSSNEEVLNTPPDMESPESKIARLQENLATKDEEIMLLRNELTAKDAANQQLRNELDCRRMADNLKTTATLAKAREEDMMVLMQRMARCHRRIHTLAASILA